MDLLDVFLKEVSGGLFWSFLAVMIVSLVVGSNERLGGIWKGALRVRHRRLVSVLSLIHI